MASDTFLEVRRKRDKKKVVRVRSSRMWTAVPMIIDGSMHHRGIRGGRESYPSSNISEGRNYQWMPEHAKASNCVNTRAEVSDISIAVKEGADAIMLSGAH